MSSSAPPPAVKPAYLLLSALVLICAAAAVAYLATSGRGDAGPGGSAAPSLPARASQDWVPQDVLFVSGGGRDAGNHCTSASAPCRTLGRAVGLARGLRGARKKQIKLAGGRHKIGCTSLSGINNLRISGAGPGLTTLVGPFPGDREPRPCSLLLISGEDVVLEGFSLEGIADHMGDGIGVRINGPARRVLLRDLRFDGRGQASGQHPGTMGLQLNGAPPREVQDVTVRRCQFLGFKRKAAMLVKGPSVAVAVYNSVFHGNDRGIGISTASDSRSNLKVIVENCIFHKNVKGISADRSPTRGDRYHLDYNLFFRGGSERVLRGRHDLYDVDPLFVHPPRDFSLQSTAGGHKGCSPAIDRGDPAHDHSREPAPAGGRINMGIWGNTRAAARSCGR